MLESVTLPAAERDPARHGGGLVVPMVQDRPRLNKPPLIYWLQAASAGVLSSEDPKRDAIWMYRVPSLLAAILAVLITWRLGASMFGESAGKLGAALLAVCPVVAWEAHQARADMVLLAWTTLAVWGLWEIWKTKARRHEGTEARSGGGTLRWALVFWIAVAGGVMTKGPVTPLVVGLAAVGMSAVSRRWGWLLALHAEIGTPIVAAAVVPWVWAVAERIGWEKYKATVLDEVLGRSVHGKEGHWGPPGYHLLLLAVLFWPGSLMTASGLASAVRAARRKVEPASVVDAGGTPVEIEGAGISGDACRFCLAWIVPAWIVFEAVSTKLPHYVLPMYPAVALLSARAVLSVGAQRTMNGGPAMLGHSIWLAIGAGIVFAALGVTALTVRMRTGMDAGVVAIAAAVAGVVALWNLRISWGGVLSNEGVRAQLGGIVAACVTFPVLLSFGLPPWMRTSENLVNAASKLDPTGRRALAAVGYHEDSLTFLTRGRVQRIDAPQVEDWLAKNPDGIVLWQMGREELPASLKSEETVRGINYARGRQVEIAVAERAK